MQEITAKTFLMSMEKVIGHYRSGFLKETEAADIGEILLNLEKGEIEKSWEMYENLDNFQKEYMIREHQTVFYSVEYEGRKLNETYCINNIAAEEHKLFIGEKVKVLKITGEEEIIVNNKSGTQNKVKSYQLDELTPFERSFEI